MNRNWFTRMLLLYVPVFLIVPAFLFFFFFQSLSDNNRKDAERSNEFVTRQALLMIDSSLSSLDQTVTLEMLRNRTINRYFSQPSNENLPLQVDVMNIIRDLKMTNPLIHSIYMVRADDKRVLNESTAYPLSQYADQTFIERKLDSPNSNWSDVRLYKELDSDKGTPVVSLTRSVSIFNKNLGLFVVNVSAESLKVLVHQMYNPDFSVLHLYDQGNNSVFDQMNDETLANETTDPTGLLKSEAASEYTGWRVVRTIQNAGVVNFFIALSNIWFKFGLLLCAASIAWIIYVTRQNYRPIQKLVTQLQSLNPRDARSSETVVKNEFNFINTTLENMIEQNNRFQLQFEDDLKVKQNFFIYELLEGTRAVSMQDWEVEAEKHGLPLQFGRQQIVVLEIDRRAEWIGQYKQEERALHKRSIEASVRELAMSHGYVVWLLWVSVQQLAVILVEPVETEIPLSGLELAHCWQETLRDELSVTMSIGLGESVEHPENLRDSYREALDALQSKSANGTSMVIPYSTGLQVNENVFAHFHRIDSIVDDFRLSEPRWRTDFKELFLQLQAEGVSRKGISSVLHYLIFNLDKAVAGMNTEYQNLWKLETLPSLYQILEEVEILDEMAESVYQLMDLFSEQLETRRDSRNQGTLIKEVKGYIESNFKNPNLSLDYLQLKFGVNGKYLSRLFKEEYGLKFVDFLIDLRMQEAKRLLLESSLSVQDITEKLGYSSPISFARTFKKIVGMSPVDFRKGK